MAGILDTKLMPFGDTTPDSKYYFTKIGKLFSNIK